MSSAEESRPSRQVFYGWFIVAACFAAILTIGETFWSFGVFFKPLETEFGWSRSTVSSGYTAFVIGYAISIAATGRLVDKYNPRYLLLASALLTGIGMALCSLVVSVGQLRLFLFIAGLGSGPVWSVPNATTVRWFYQRRRAGLALAIVVSGVGVGSLIFVPLLNYFILNYGWRNTFILAGLMPAVIVALAALIIKPKPVEPSVAEPETGTLKLANNDPWSLRKIALSRAFIGLVLVNCLMNLASQMVMVHFIPHATDVGISATAAAAALGFVGGMSIPGRLLSGFSSAKVVWQRLVIFAAFGLAASLLWLTFLQAAWMLYVFVIVYGFCLGAITPALLGILGDFFGMRWLGVLIGLQTSVSMFVSAFSPYLAGLIFDVTGSYFWAFLIVTVLMLGGGLIAMAIKRPPSADAPGQ